MENMGMWDFLLDSFGNGMRNWSNGIVDKIFFNQEAESLEIRSVIVGEVYIDEEVHVSS